VLIGALTDIGGSLGAGQILMVIYGVWLAAEGMGVAELEQAMRQIDPGSGVGLAQSVVGTLFSWLGGFVCARLAPEPELKWVAVTAAISMASGFAMSLLPGVDYPMPLLVLLSVLGAAAMMLGGWMGAKRNAESRAAP
jgi:hypothetical protein